MTARTADSGGVGMVRVDGDIATRKPVPVPRIPSGPVALLDAGVVSGTIPNTGVSADFTFSHAVAAGAMLSIVVNDTYWWGFTITGASDSKGNIYTLDTPDGNFGWAEGYVQAITSFLDTALIPGDTITLTWDFDGWGDVPYVFMYGSSFSGAGAFAGYAQGGSYIPRSGSDTASLTITPNAGDLLIAYAGDYASAMSFVPGSPWTPFATEVGNGAIERGHAQLLDAAWGVAPTSSPITYDTMFTGTHTWVQLLVVRYFA